MKYLLIALVACIGCAQPPPPYWTMTWACATQSCAYHMGAWNGAGQFNQENDCLVWETAFINSYQGATVTACTQHN